MAAAHVSRSPARTTAGCARIHQLRKRQKSMTRLHLASVRSGERVWGACTLTPSSHHGVHRTAGGARGPLLSGVSQGLLLEGAARRWLVCL